MELQEAKTLVNSLAEGVDPLTGEVLPDDSPYNQPRIIRALYTLLMQGSEKTRAAKKTSAEKQQANLDAGRPRNAGLPWADEARQELAARFNGGTPLDELEQHLERTRGAILAELVRQGLVEPPAADEPR